MPQAVTFVSRASDFQVTLETEGLPMLDANNIVVGKTRGRRVNFVRGTYVTRNPEEIRKLKEAGSFGNEFWEVGHQPGAIHPPEPDVLADIMTALARRQHDRLIAIQEREQETHQRPNVLAAVARALGELGDTEHGKRAPGKPPQPKPAVEAEAA